MGEILVTFMGNLERPPFEHVVLVDNQNLPTGTAEKSVIHGPETPLHRGFSVFLFDRSGNLLLQQRNLEKKTWPGVWSNSCCGHPQLGETTVEAMQRRVNDELGIADVQIQVVLPDYRYRYERFGVVENEFCPVAVGVIEEEPVPNPDEVNAIAWKPWEEFLSEVAGESEYSEWSIEEARLLARNESFQEFYKGITE